MICPKCGATLADTSQFCSNCGSALQQAQFATPTPVPGAPTSAPPPFTGLPQTSGKAIGSLVCGIINVFPLSVVAVVLGHLSLSEIKKSAGRLKGEGLAIAGLVLGYLGLIAIPFILIVAAIAIPNLLRAKMAANESSAVGSVRSLITAETMYQATHSDAGFTCKLSDLSGLVGPELASGQHTGYMFTLQNCSAAQEGGPVSKFQITASPITPHASGRRAFCADESGVVREDADGSAENCLDHGSLL